ncbi:MAG: 8-oxo-dGTP pyrophosphatase MutT (NUDIX family) [Marivirga sp.]|jgi:8-oxo-dGTP pyrophosphatase MutT (NUDIX family)
MHNFIEFLKQRLQANLPGELAHQKMMATQIGQQFRMNHTTPPRKGGVMIALFEEDGKLYFPLTQRPKYDGVHGGQVSLPGGKMEVHDEDLIATAIRETAEEIGVLITRSQVIGTLTDLNVTASNFIVSPVVSILEGKPKFNRDPREVDQIFSAELGHLSHHQTLKETELTVGPNIRLRAPYFDIEEKIVWGATSMILNEFVALIKEFENE